MKIRQGRSEDAVSVLKVHVGAIVELCAKDYTKDQIDAWVSPKQPEHYLCPISEGRLFVALINDVIVGFGEYGIDEGARINAVYVSLDYCRQGVGRGLFQRLISELIKLGYQTVRLDASVTSVPFYEAMGCARDVCADHSHVLRSGMKIECIRMTLRINPNR